MKKIAVNIVSILVALVIAGCTSSNNKYGTPTVQLNYPDTSSPVNQTPTFELQFSQPVTGVTVNSVVLSEGAGGAQMPLNLTNNSSDRTIYTFGPIRNLDKDVNYELLVTSQIEDDYGYHLKTTAFDFSTGDTLPPTAELVSPLPNESNASQSLNFQLKFSKPVQNVDQSTVYLQEDDNGAVETFVNPIITDNDKTYTFNIQGWDTGRLLKPNTQYTLVVLPYVTDQTAYQYPLAQTEFTFTTGDTTSPTVVLLSPHNGQINSPLTIDSTAATQIIKTSSFSPLAGSTPTGNIAFVLKFSKPVQNVTRDIISISGAVLQSGTLHVIAKPVGISQDPQQYYSNNLSVAQIFSADTTGDAYEVMTPNQLPTSTSISITATSAIHDTTDNQNPLNEKTLTFQTGTIPTITASVPLADQNNVPLQPTITLSADQAVSGLDPSSVTLMPFPTCMAYPNCPTIPMWILGGPQAYQLLPIKPLSSSQGYILIWNSSAIRGADSGIPLASADNYVGTGNYTTFTTGDYENPTYSATIFYCTSNCGTTSAGYSPFFAKGDPTDTREDVPVQYLEFNLTFSELGQPYPVTLENGAVTLHQGSPGGPVVTTSVLSTNNPAYYTIELNGTLNPNGVPYYLVLDPNKVTDNSINHNLLATQAAFSFSTEDWAYIVSSSPGNNSNIDPSIPSITLYYNKAVQMTGYNVNLKSALGNLAAASITLSGGVTITNAVIVSPENNTDPINPPMLYGLEYDLFSLDLANVLQTPDHDIFAPQLVYHFNTNSQAVAKLQNTNIYLRYLDSKKTTAGQKIYLVLNELGVEGNNPTIQFSKPVTGLITTADNPIISYKQYPITSASPISFSGPCGDGLAWVACMDAQTKIVSDNNDCQTYEIGVTHQTQSYNGDVECAAGNCYTTHTVGGLCGYTEDNVMTLNSTTITDQQGHPIAITDQQGNPIAYDGTNSNGNTIFTFDVAPDSSSVTNMPLYYGPAK